MPATHTYDNGDKYEGGLLGGKRTGHGVYHDANGSVYTGTWSDDNLNGPGKYQGEDGNYDGEWKDSLKHGRGTFLWTNGDKYSGEWAEDSMNGRGEFIWTNGKVYVGQWCDGIRSGAGVLKFPNGAKYEGQWKNDKCHGKGRYIEDAGVYEGDWVDNQKHGRGIFHYKDGRRYDGEWVRDKKTTGLVWTPDGIFKVTFNEAGAVVSQAEAKPEDLTPHLRATPKAAPKSSKEDEDIYGYCQRVGAGQAGDDDRPWTRRPQAGWDYSQKKSYAELKIPSIWNRPDIDAVNRERYLSDAEFEQVFQIPRALYDLMPQWKKNSKKKQLKLF